MKELTIEDRINILHTYLVEDKIADDVGRLYRVSKTLVYSLASVMKKDHEMIERLKRKREEKATLKETIS